MNSLKFLGWDKKPKTLYRYIKEGDIFAFQIKIDLFGFGRILAKNPLGVSAEIFDIFSSNPDDFLRNKDFDKMTTLFITILDAHSLFQEKLDTEWRIIEKILITIILMLIFIHLLTLSGKLCIILIFLKR